MKHIIFLLAVYPFISVAQIAQETTEPVSRVPMTELEETKAPSRLGFSGEIWLETMANHVKREDWMNILLIRPYYKLTDNSSFAVGQELLHSIGGNEDKPGGTFSVLDTHVEYAHSNVAEMGPFTVKGYLRPYLPTSEASRDPVSGRNLMVRGQLSATAPINGHFKAGYWVEPRYFFQKNNSYESADGEVTHNEQARIKHWLGLTADVDGFVGYQFVGINSRYYHDDGPQLDALYWETGLGYQFSENFVFYAGGYTETTHDIKKKDFLFFDENEFLYFLDGIFTF